MADDQDQKEIRIDADEGLETRIAKATQELKAQLAAKETETANYKGQYEQAARIANERDQAARKAESELQRVAGYATRTEHSAIVNAIAAADAETENIQRDIALAVETADGKRAAELTKKLTEVVTRKGTLELGRQKLEDDFKAEQARQERAAQAPRQQPQPRPQPQIADPYEAAIAQLPENQKTWLRQHKDKGYLTPGQPIKPQVLSAYYAAQAKGLREDSPEFTKHMDVVLGHTKDEDAPAEAAAERFVEVPAEQPAPQRQTRQAQPSRRPTPAAPVSREPEGGRQSNRTVRLTADEAQTAERMGMSHAEYANNLREAMKRHPELYAGRQL